MFPSAVVEMTVVHIFIRCFLSLNQLELEARPMVYHLPAICTQPLLSHRPGGTGVSAHQPQPRPRPLCQPQPCSRMESWGPHPLGSCYSSRHPQNPVARRAIVCNMPFAAQSSWCYLPQRGLTGLPGPEMPFASVWGHKDESQGPRPAQLIPAWAPGPAAQHTQRELSALDMGCARTTRAGHARPPSLQDVPPSPSSPPSPSLPRVPVFPRTPLGGSLQERAVWPLPSSVGPLRCGATTAPCSWAGTVLLWIPSWGSKGSKAP